jgi:succinate-acetate transporter protein
MNTEALKTIVSLFILFVLILMALVTKNVVGSQILASIGIITGALAGYLLMNKAEVEE